ncbi:iron-containing alcohol dehydrogenase family protein [Aestuariivivens sediminicola]|uniref:iron-containing alcohol dehydrogenase family protein n=1 Tax=Aestuariivivens sediminicola TaxID=2913560 RepID=UPI001F55F14C|nr:iron-containing alcohol dehydrogenase [Aestuariivivens sediminicola]
MTHYSIKPKLVVAPISFEVLTEFNLGSRVLILISKTVLDTFNFSSIFDELKKERTLYIYNHISPDAPFEDLDKVINDLTGKRIESIIAIGGGSVIDAAKALSIAFQGVSYKDVFYKRAEMPKNKIKVIAIPTTAGTGAELSFGAIIYDKENSIKGGLRGDIIQPNGVIIDANLHNACPSKLKAEVGFDCLTHAIETYISKKSNPLVKNQSIGCIRNIFSYLIPACKENNLYAMEKIALSSALMGINLAYSSTCLPHRIQYVIGPLTGTSHAQGLIALYKGWLSHLKDLSLIEFKRLADDLDLSIIGFLDKVQLLKESLDIDYSISDLGINENQIIDISNQVSGNLEADPSYTGIETIKKILFNSL